jgi:hypothetical protein
LARIQSWHAALAVDTPNRALSGSRQLTPLAAAAVRDLASARCGPVLAQRHATSRQPPLFQSLVAAAWIFSFAVRFARPRVGIRPGRSLGCPIRQRSYRLDVNGLLTRPNSSRRRACSLLDSCQVACSDDRMRFDFTTRASPEQVFRALTDFTESRLETWNRTLDPKTYELRESGQTWAVARESSPRSPFWVSLAMTGPTPRRSVGPSWTVAMREVERVWSRSHGESTGAARCTRSGRTLGPA